MDTIIEAVKLISSILGCILSAITLGGIFIKPVRNCIINKISKWSDKEKQDKAIQEHNEILENLNAIIENQNVIIQEKTKDIQEVKEAVIILTQTVTETLSELSDRIFRNEKDRLRGELFNCGNRCRRNITLTGEEFRYIQGVWTKYSEELHCNSIGEDEYKFIKDYFNSKENQDRLNKKM